MHVIEWWGVGMTSIRGDRIVSAASIYAPADVVDRQALF
jgi:hypothetical protein